nr:hypothetical protein VW1E2_00050 [Enterobacter sp.]
MVLTVTVNAVLKCHVVLQDRSDTLSLDLFEITMVLYQ